VTLGGGGGGGGGCGGIGATKPSRAFRLSSAESFSFALATRSSSVKAWRRKIKHEKLEICFFFTFPHLRTCYAICDFANNTGRRSDTLQIDNLFILLYYICICYFLYRNV
jgi:hypothetical protein